MDIFFAVLVGLPTYLMIGLNIICVYLERRTHKTPTWTTLWGMLIVGAISWYIASSLPYPGIVGNITSIIGLAALIISIIRMVGLGRKKA